MYLEVVEKPCRRETFGIRPPFYAGRYHVRYEWHADDELLGASVQFPQQFKTYEVAFPLYQGFGGRPTLQRIAGSILRETECVIRWAIVNNCRRGGNDVY